MNNFITQLNFMHNEVRVLFVQYVALHFVFVFASNVFYHNNVPISDLLAEFAFQIKTRHCQVKYIISSEWPGMKACLGEYTLLQYIAIF